MRILLVALTLMVAACSGPTDLVAPPSPCISGEEAMRDQAYDLAIRDLTACLDMADLKQDTRETALKFRGRSYFGLGDFPRGLADFDAMVALRPRSSELNVARAQANVVAGRYDEALRGFTTAIDLGRESKVAQFAYQGRGVVLQILGRYEEAAADYRRALDHPDLPPLAVALDLYVAEGLAGRNAGEELREQADDAEDPSWRGVAAQMFLAEASPADVAAALRDGDSEQTPVTACEATVALSYIGYYHLLRGERARATEVFQRAARTGDPRSCLEIPTVRAELARMNA